MGLFTLKLKNKKRGNRRNREGEAVGDTVCEKKGGRKGRRQIERSGLICFRK